MKFEQLKFTKSKTYYRSIKFNLVLAIFPFTKASLGFHLKVRNVAKSDFSIEGRRRLSEVQKILKSQSRKINESEIEAILYETLSKKIVFTKQGIIKANTDKDFFVDLFALALNRLKFSRPDSRGSVTPKKDGLMIFSYFIKKGSKKTGIQIKTVNIPAKIQKDEFILNEVTQQIFLISGYLKKRPNLTVG